jgi:hypothetical protein
MPFSAEGTRNQRRHASGCDAECSLSQGSFPPNKGDQSGLAL